VKKTNFRIPKSSTEDSYYLCTLLFLSPTSSATAYLCFIFMAECHDGQSYTKVCSACSI